jgi:hypothetical protein
MHSLWSGEIVAALNGSLLPERYYAETEVHIGGRIEVDVATMEHAESEGALPRNGPGGTLTLEAWAPPVPALLIPSVFPDEIEVQVRGGEGGSNLVAAIELVSPGNKDRPETRRAFAAKCAAYLYEGIGLVVVDVVTDRLANLHDELMRLMELPETFLFPAEPSIYVAAYRPVRRESGDRIECWPTPLAVGQPLPVVPLALLGGPTLPLDLETTYTAARQRSRL